MAQKRIKLTPAQILGRLGGSANTPKQNAARRRNARFAGRPRRVCKHCGAPVLGGHVDRALDATCGAHGWVWQKRADVVAAKPVIATTDRKTLSDIATLLVDDPSPTAKSVRAVLQRAGIR